MTSGPIWSAEPSERHLTSSTAHSGTTPGSDSLQASDSIAAAALFPTWYRTLTRRKFAFEINIRALENLDVIADTWSDPGPKRTRFQMDTEIPYEAGWDPLRLQFIQVCKVIGHSEPRIGRPLSKKDPFRYFVDRGRWSPAYRGNGWPCGHPDRPYFYPPRSMRTEPTEKSITYFDSPAEVDRTTEAYFEAALVEIGLNGGADRVLKVLKYGWIDGGNRRCVESGDGSTFRTDPVVDGPLSGEFRSAVLLDYPDFRRAQ